LTFSCAILLYIVFPIQQKQQLHQQQQQRNQQSRQQQRQQLSTVQQNDQTNTITSYPRKDVISDSSHGLEISQSNNTAPMTNNNNNNQNFLRGLTRGTLGECQGNCFSNNDCRPGTICARSTKQALVAKGYSDCKAYCNWTLSQIGDFFCYDPTKLKPRLQECEGQCDTTNDCFEGLSCTKSNTIALLSAGYNEKKAYCTTSNNPNQPDEHVCYNATKVVPKMSECSGNCMSDNDCQTGLSCPRTTNTSLVLLGYRNISKAYCTSWNSQTQMNDYVCYNETKLTSRITECQANADCRVDTDCRVGLTCAKTTEGALASLGYDKDRAYCPTLNPLEARMHVCYNASLLMNKKRECQADCQADNDCAVGLSCTKQHQSELLSAKSIFDTKRAYCSNSYSEAQYVCYNPIDLRVASRVKECQVDCDVDADCDNGLICADSHQSDLSQIGLDRRKAYCGSNVGEWHEEVCYDPKKALGCSANEFVMDYNKCCQVINFDDITNIVPNPYTGDAYQAIPNGYYGLNWINFYVQSMATMTNITSFGYNTGFLHGTKSYPNHAFNGFGRNAEAMISLPILSSNSSSISRTKFTLRRLSVTTAFTPNLTVQITGYKTNTSVIHHTVLLSNYTTTMIIDLPSTFTNLTAIKISAFRTNNDTFVTEQQPTHVVLDDIIICSS
jgi:type II secretory pathway pseudopilin PulG